MEQRKRLPTGTFERPTAQQLRERLEATQVGRTRHFTGEHAVVKSAPPPAPGQRPVLDALGNVSAVLGEQVETQHDVKAALVQMAQRYQQLERTVLQGVNAHANLSRDAVEAVRQSNMLHEQTNQLLTQATASLTDLTRALQRNSRLRKQAAESWLVRVVYGLKRHNAGALAAVSVSVSLAFVAYSVAIYLTR